MLGKRIVLLKIYFEGAKISEQLKCLLTCITDSLVAQKKLNTGGIAMGEAMYNDPGSRKIWTVPLTRDEARLLKNKKR